MAEVTGVQPTAIEVPSRRPKASSVGSVGGLNTMHTPPPSQPELVTASVPVADTWAQLREEMLAELIGTFFIMIFGVGSVCAAVTTSAQAGLWQVAVVWGFGVTLAILATAEVSGAHLNPAVSLAFALRRPADCPWRKLPWYWLAQIIGGVLGGLVNLWAFNSVLNDLDESLGVDRGEAGSNKSAMTFGMYYPNPGFSSIPESSVSTFHAFGIEAWGTAVLMFMILALTDKRNSVLGPHKQLAPFFIGFTVACLISVYAPLTQAGWNPARDLGPRIVSAMAGWGSVAFPGPRNGFWVYTFGPLVGAPLGALAFDFTLARGLRRKAELAERASTQEQDSVV